MMRMIMNNEETDNTENKWYLLFKILEDTAKANGFELTIDNYGCIDKNTTTNTLDVKLTEIGSYYNILYNNKLGDSDNYNGLLDFINTIGLKHDYYEIHSNDKLPSEVINMLTTTGIQNVNTCLDLYKFLNDDKTSYQLSDTGWFNRMSYGLTVDDIMDSFIISDRFTGHSKSAILEDIVGDMMISASENADFSILKRINSIDTSCLPGSILKPILIANFITSANDVNNSEFNWLIDNMDAAYNILTNTTEACNPSIVSMMLQYEFDKMADKLDDSYLEYIMASAYEMNDVNMYANAIITALFIRIFLTEILSKFDKLRNDSDLRYNLLVCISDYNGNLKHITEFICNQLADNIDKPIEFIRELIISDMQDIMMNKKNA